MALEIQVLAWDKHRNASGLNRLIGPHISLCQWISNVITEKNPALIHFAICDLFSYCIIGVCLPNE